MPNHFEAPISETTVLNLISVFAELLLNRFSL